MTRRSSLALIHPGASLVLRDRFLVDWFLGLRSRLFGLRDWFLGLRDWFLGLSNWLLGLSNWFLGLRNRLLAPGTLVPLLDEIRSLYPLAQFNEE